MAEESKNVGRIQQLICGCADELRDYWLAQQSAKDVSAIMALSISQQRMLRKVWRMTAERQDGVMLRELADQLSLSCSAVSVMVDAMVKRGVLVRQPSQEDRRKVLIRISDSGKAFSQRYDKMFECLCQEFAAGKSAAEMEAFTGMLDEFITFLYQKNEEK